MLWKSRNLDDELFIILDSYSFQGARMERSSQIWEGMRWKGNSSCQNLLAAIWTKAKVTQLTPVTLQSINGCFAWTLSTLIAECSIWTSSVTVTWWASRSVTISPVVCDTSRTFSIRLHAIPCILVNIGDVWQAAALSWFLVAGSVPRSTFLAFTSYRNQLQLFILALKNLFARIV